MKSIKYQNVELTVEGKFCNSLSCIGWQLTNHQMQIYVICTSFGHFLKNCKFCYLLYAVVDQLPRLGKRELVFLLLFTWSFVVSVSRRFPYLLVLGMGCAIWAVTWENRIFAYAKTKTQISCGYHETDQRCFRYMDSTIPLSLSYLNTKFKPLAIFWGGAAWFVWDLVGSPEDRFSDVAAHFIVALPGPSINYSIVYPLLLKWSCSNQHLNPCFGLIKRFPKTCILSRRKKPVQLLNKASSCFTDYHFLSAHSEVQPLVAAFDRKYMWRLTISIDSLCYIALFCFVSYVVSFHSSSNWSFRCPPLLLLWKPAATWNVCRLRVEFWLSTLIG